jgi:hypothetical protein
MIEALNRGNEVYFKAVTPDELYEQLFEYQRLEWPEAIKNIATVRVNSFVDDPFLREGQEEKGKLTFAKPQLVRGEIRVFQRIPAPEHYTEHYIDNGWMKVIQLKDAQFLDEEGNVLRGDETDGWTPIMDLAPDPLTGIYSVEVTEQDIAPLDSEPNPEMLLDAIEIMLPMHVEANRQNELFWATAFSLYGKGLSKKEFKAELEKVEAENEDVDWSAAELASSVHNHLLERDVAGFHLANPNSLQAILRSGEFDYYGLHDKLHSTYRPDPRYEDHCLLKSDLESRRKREEVWQQWQGILQEVAKRNGWTAYVDSECTERDELQIYVTNGEVTAEMLVYIKRWIGGSAISIAGSKYGINESHVRKTASLARGVHSKTTNTWPISKEHHILDIERGTINLSDMPTLEELTFFEQVIAAYL